MIRGSCFKSPCFSYALAFCLAIYSVAISFFFHSCTSPFFPSKPRVLHYLLPTDPASSNSLCATQTLSFSAATPLKVYMYDLPRKFTYGVIEEYLRARSIDINGTSQLRYPGNQHSAEWFLFMDLQKPHAARAGSPALRVESPQDADIFYVPFFSSLSLLVNFSRSGSSPVSYSDEQMQMELVDWLEGQETWKRNNGRDHVIICQDPNALHLMIDLFKNSILLLSDFGRLKTDQGSWWKDVVLPYTHRIDSYVKENTTLERSTLLFFMGNRYRKEGGKVRDQLFKVLENEEGMVLKHGVQSREGRRLAAQGMRTSKFCLHPAGDTPSACRLFDAIVSICVPVVVSDKIELPFEDELDYSKFAIFVPSSKALEPGYLVSLLRQIDDEKLRQYQEELRKVRRYFEYGEVNGAVDHIWRAIASKLPRVRTLIHRNRRDISLDASITTI
ncbi:hypothetical protein GOP47_0004461 [Adiantum capillus-veneris]|uniref:Exostosin GT47 domain-containing protein n=1 Tax=Adiantum capillus-veneris TaxID=13818 RepID=A0A9D4ZML9_ADICA|nr:hypothetical protein GOP47_0004461 [Adiantum capillus-veneris]